MSQVTAQAYSVVQPKVAVGCSGAQFFSLKSTTSAVGLGMMALLQIRGGGETDVSFEYTHFPEQQISFSLA